MCIVTHGIGYCIREYLAIETAVQAYQSQCNGYSYYEELCIKYAHDYSLLSDIVPEDVNPRIRIRDYRLPDMISEVSR